MLYGVFDLINGKALRDGIISASNNITNHKKSVDALNVFPVPDGDTGTNMSLTMAAAARELERLGDDAPLSLVAHSAASALLRGARGNSGVILSLLFRGIESGLKGFKEADAKTFALALNMGVDNAYKAVMKPTEGTILTVARLFTKKALLDSEIKDISFDRVWSRAVISGQAALEDTPNILPVLKKAGVVDAGGQGLMYIFKGMESVFSGKGIIETLDKAAKEDAEKPKAAAERLTEEIRYAYCVEFLISKEEESKKSPALLRAYLESIGDCVVVVEDSSLIKVHCHSNEPGNIITKALLFGQLINIKIDNMRKQHENALWGAAPPNEFWDSGGKNSDELSREKPFGIVAVACGNGIEQILADIGVDGIVSGGQTMNPSTDDILRAIEKIPAKEIFVLPNNKNIIMAAEQTVPLSDKTIRVLHTRTLPEGIAAAISFDESLTGEENHLNMSKAAEKISTALITYAARDSKMGAQQIKKGSILGIENGKIVTVEESVLLAAFKTIKHLVGKKTSLITVYYGKDVKKEEANELINMLNQRFGKECEIVCIDGGQPVYYYIISVQ